MSTRGVYTFKDDRNTIHVYKHSDNYPTGAAEAIEEAVLFSWLASDRHRFEADDFAAAFVAANKAYHLRELHRQYFEALQNNTGQDWIKTKLEVTVFPSYYLAGGGVYLMKSGRIKTVAPADIEYRYEITWDDKAKELIVKAWDTNYWDVPREETLIYNGTLKGMMAWAKEFEALKAAS